MKYKLAVITAIVWSFNSFAWEVDLGAAAEYNIFVKNDFTHTGSSDSQGKIAVGGNASIDSYDVAVNYEPNTGREGVQFWQDQTGYADVLVVQGDLNTNRSDNIKGNLVLGGDLYKSGSLANGEDHAMGDVFEYSKKPLDFDSAFAHLTQLSSDLANLTNTGTFTGKDSNPWYTDTNNLVFTPNHDMINDQGALILDITGDALTNATDLFAFDLDPNMPIIVNVSGNNIDLDSVNYRENLAQDYSGSLGYVGQEKAMPSNILYNFFEAESISFSGGFYGNILAPSADFSFIQGDLSGQVIAKNWTSSNGAQANLWNGLYPSEETKTAEVSAPAPIALFLLALLALYHLSSGKKLTRQTSLA